MSDDAMPVGRPPLPDGLIHHGTLKGYHNHLRRNEKPCDSCRKANNTYYREYRQKRLRQRSIIKSILLGGQSRRWAPWVHPEIVNIIEHHVNKYADEDQKRRLFDE